MIHLDYMITKIKDLNKKLSKKYIYILLFLYILYTRYMILIFIIILIFK